MNSKGLQETTYHGTTSSYTIKLQDFRTQVIMLKLIHGAFASWNAVWIAPFIINAKR